VIKDILLAEVNDSRLIEAPSRLEHGSQEFAQVSDTSGISGPRRSVGRPHHYNYSAFVREAIESVVASVGVPLELVVVDNHSDAPELDHLRSVIADYEWFPIRLVANAADQGRRPRATSAPVMPRTLPPVARRRQHALPHGANCCTPRSARAPRPSPTG